MIEYKDYSLLGCHTM